MPRRLPIAFALLALASCHPAVESRERHIVHRGEAVVLVGEPAGDVYVPLAKSQSYTVEKLTAEKKQAELDAMVDRKEAFKVRVGTRVQVLADSSDERQIEISEGPQRGKRGWVTWEFLRSPARGDL